MTNKGLKLSSFLDGLGRLFDFGGTLANYNHSKSNDEADYRALRSDWEAIGNDMLKCLNITIGKDEENE